MDTASVSVAEIIRFAAVLFRVAGMMVFAPFFSSRSIPNQVRVAIVLVSTLALAPSISLTIPPTFGLAQILGFVLTDALFGMVLGLAASFIFAGAQLAGQLIGFQLGFSIINLIDPQSEVETSVVAFLENYVCLLFFLLINGHHWFFLAVSDSFHYLPLQGIHLQGAIVQDFIRLSSQILVSGLQIAGPVIVVTFIADVVLGIISRTAPQINVLIVGMPLKTLVGFGCMSFSFYFLPHFLEKTFTPFFHDVFAVLHRMGQ